MSLKGVGTAVATILIIVIFTIFFGVYLYMANNNIETRTQLNFESLSLIKLKSTFLLFNESLGTTWFISTVQATFATGKDGIGCGKPGDAGGGVTTDEGYWLQTKDPSYARSGVTDNQGNLRTPATSKYNKLGFVPQVCYPRDEHAVGYIRNVLTNGGFLNLRQLRPEDAGGVAITLYKNADNVATDIRLNLLDARIESAFKQRITASYQGGTIDRQTENNFSIETSLRRMAGAGRLIVDALLLLGDGMSGGPTTPTAIPRYVPQGFSGIAPTASQSSYRQEFESFFTNQLVGFNSRSALPSDVSVSTTVTTTLSANTALNSGIFEAARQAGTGLVLHYDAKVTYSEPARYYYHNEGNNKFEKVPITLEYKAEDYLPALDCVLWQRPAFPFDIAQFNWQTSNDMLCCAGLLFSCGSSIPDLPAGNQIAVGDKIKDAASGGGPEQDRCTGILGGAEVKCTANGFTIE